MDVKQLLQFYADGKREFTGIDLSRANLMGSTRALPVVGGG